MQFNAPLLVRSLHWDIADRGVCNGNVRSTERRTRASPSDNGDATHKIRVLPENESPVAKTFQQKRKLWKPHYAEESLTPHGRSSGDTLPSLHRKPGLQGPEQFRLVRPNSFPKIPASHICRSPSSHQNPGSHNASAVRVVMLSVSFRRYPPVVATRVS